MRRVRFLFMDRWGLPSDAGPSTVAIVRLERMGRCRWVWQIWSAKPVLAPRVRPSVDVLVRQGQGVSALHAHYQASSRVKSLHDHKE